MPRSTPLSPIHMAALAGRNGWREEQFGTSAQGVPLRAWWPTGRPTRVFWAAIHGEETFTLQLAWLLLRTVHADDACAVVVPVLNPDGVLLATRQNARGVDLNRNFPTRDWEPTPMPSFPPTTLVRRPEARTQLSSPGSAPGSEPETQAITALVERVQPEAIVDLHSPLACVLAEHDAAVPLAAHLAAPAGLRVLRGLETPAPGNSGTWASELGVVSVTYEIELDQLPQLWRRHGAGLVNAIVERRHLPGTPLAGSHDVAAAT